MSHCVGHLNVQRRPDEPFMQVALSSKCPRNSVLALVQPIRSQKADTQRLLHALHGQPQAFACVSG